MRIEEVPKERAEVEIINSIKERYKPLRQKSKGPTFALTYGGTHKALMNIFGFTKDEALHIESQYHELYKESDQWVANRMEQAAKDGFVSVAFGLRVRTPVMHQCILGTRNTPKEAETEKRTAGNACGQSYCLLNNRAGVQFNREVRKSQYRLLIRPVAQIHDAQYFLIRDDADVILWANKHLVKAVSWQDDPAIYHPQVKLGGEFSVFFPNWAKECVIPNDVTTKEELTAVVKPYVEDLRKEH
jgi:DNA polymerase-1